MKQEMAGDTATSHTDFKEISKNTKAATEEEANKDALKFPKELQDDEHFNDIFENHKTPLIIFETAKSVYALLIRAKITTNTTLI
jgi:hypothetical protein